MKEATPRRPGLRTAAPGAMRDRISTDECGAHSGENHDSNPLPAIHWKTSNAPVPYPEAILEMEDTVARIRTGAAPDTVWLLEHPPLYTAGTSADSNELIDPGTLPVYRTGRGGRYTYHGPGQRIGYVMLDLARRGQDLRAFVAGLQDWIVRILAHFGVKGECRRDRIGVWIVREDGREAKIGAVGVRVRRWVTFHGISINYDPDLSHFRGIVPCGIRGHGVTSLAELGIDVGPEELDAVMRATFDDALAARATASCQSVER